MENRKTKISKRTVDAAPVPKSGENRLWDTEIKGFFVRVYASGRRVYALKYRFGALQRIYTLGVHGSPLTPEAARQAAEKALRRVAEGADPAVAKKETRTAITVKELIDKYLEDGPTSKPAKRTSSWEIDASNLRRHVQPLLGRKIAIAVTVADAGKAVKNITDGKTAADEKTDKARGRAIVRGGLGAARRTRNTAAAMFAWGVEHELVISNPFSKVRLSTSPARERFLSRQEAGRLIVALNDLVAENAIHANFADAIRILLLTGARKTEILGLRWSEVALDRKQLLLPPERTKAGGSTGERRIVLSPPALEILARRRAEAAEGCDYVFPATRGSGHIVGLRRVFAKACERAELDGLRVHDLRHSFASFAIADGVSLFLIGKLLGHASSRTTERYAHLGGDPLQDAAAAIGRQVMATEGREASEVIQLKRS